MEIGSCTALIYKVSTLLDGGARITLDIDSSSQEIIKELMGRKLEGKPLIQIGLIGLDDASRSTD